MTHAAKKTQFSCNRYHKVVALKFKCMYIKQYNWVFPNKKNYISIIGCVNFQIIQTVISV